MNSIHIGVYGLLFKGDRILLIKKARGPYTGLLDLPGGAPEYGEELLDTLAREIEEESGVIIEKAHAFANYSGEVSYFKESGPVSFYHIGLIYKVAAFNDKNLKTFIDKEDSAGADWFPLTDLDENKITPFALRALKDYKQS